MQTLSTQTKDIKHFCESSLQRQLTLPTMQSDVDVGEVLGIGVLLIGVDVVLEIVDVSLKL
jgi:hypothetical protein